MDKPLRILAVVNLALDPRFGAARVFLEVTEEWTKAGHLVEKFCLTDAFPRPPASPVTFAFRQWFFVYKAAAFVRKHGDGFDVIDALIGSVPFSKRWLRFNGLLVARSVGLPQLYDQFEQSVSKRWPGFSKGKVAGRILRSFIRWRSLRAADKSIRRADLVNLPNEEEASCLRHEAGLEDKPMIVQPYGLSIERRDALLCFAMPATARLEQKRICFIGMWNPRKGSRDWAEIIRAVRKQVLGASFCFLGTMVDSRTVLRDLGEEASDAVQSVAAYEPDQLPELLADCTVGAFPSFVEGFGLAVIEQLAAGLPTVAYDVAGPRHILGEQLPELLVPPGNVASFAAAISGILQSNPEEYQALSKRSVEIASRFSWPTIARDTLRSYETALGRLNGQARR
jgi:glycosyltransferase involved in cell wall biosynthesis